MANYKVSLRAAQDLTDIYYYYAYEQEEPAYADALQDKLVNKFGWLTQNPAAGHWRPAEDQNKHFRFWSVDSYQIVYREVEPGYIEISRIYHQSRNLKRLLSEEGKE